MEIIEPEGFLLAWLIICVVIMLGNLALMLVALIRMLKNNALDTNNKLIWTLLIVSVPLVGPILYLAMGNKKVY
jgi:hypothetical protein